MKSLVLNFFPQPLHRWIPLLIVGGLGIMWEATVEIAVMEGNAWARDAFSTPSAIFVEMVHYVSSTRGLYSIGATTLRVVPGLLFGSAVGYVLAPAVTLLPLINRTVGLLVSAVLAISGLSIYYLFIWWFPLGEGPRIAFSIYLGFIILFSYTFYVATEWLYERDDGKGRRGDPAMLELFLTYRNLGANRLELYRDLLALLAPHAYKAFVVATASAFTKTVFTESHAANLGVGWGVWTSENRGAVYILSRTFVLSGLAVLTCLLGERLKRFMAPWEK